MLVTDEVVAFGAGGDDAAYSFKFQGILGEEVEDIFQCAGDAALEDGEADEEDITSHDGINDGFGVAFVLGEIPAIAKIKVQFLQIEHGDCMAAGLEFLFEMS